MKNKNASLASTFYWHIIKKYKLYRIVYVIREHNS